MVDEVALHNAIEQACLTYKNVLICGDYGHRTIDWILLQCESEGKKFLDLTLDCFPLQHVNEPTGGKNILHCTVLLICCFFLNLCSHHCCCFAFLVIGLCALQRNST